MYDDGGVVLDPDCSDFGPPHALPDELELTPPGAELGQMLAAAADRSVLSGPDLLLLTQARARQIAHLQAQLMADLVAIAARCQPRISQPPPGSGRRAEPIDHAVDEIAANLTWTNTAASKQLDFAERLVDELPEVHTAMLAGHLDWPKARVLADGVTGLDPETARTITALLLPGAAKRTTGQLRARLAKLIILADPDAAQRRYRQGLKGRRVEHGHEDDGTARLTGRWLPAARAAAANSRIQAIADWLKDSGDRRTIDQIRADILLDLLQGHPIPGPDGQVLHHLPGDPDEPGTEDHPDHEINGDSTDDEATDEDNEQADTGDHQPGQDEPSTHQPSDHQPSDDERGPGDTTRRHRRIARAARTGQAIQPHRPGRASAGDGSDPAAPAPPADRPNSPAAWNSPPPSPPCSAWPTTPANSAPGAPSSPKPPAP